MRRFSILPLLLLAQSVHAAEPVIGKNSAIARYARYAATMYPKSRGGLEWGDVDLGWQKRVLLEFAIVNKDALKHLRAALKHKNELVRAKAARVLGIRADHKSADALAALVKTDPSHLVRIRAVESLGFLKVKAKVVAAAKKDKHGGVRWSAVLAEEQLKSKFDYGGQVRRAFRASMSRNRMGIAKVGKPAPDFAVETLAGNPFQLSSVLGKRPIAIYFAAFDG